MSRLRALQGFLAVALAFALVFGWGGSAASACPLCHTRTADEVRASLAATAGDAGVLLAVILPFLLIAGVVALIDRHGRGVGSR